MKTYIADKETLDDVHANTKALLAAQGDNDRFKIKRYGYKINKADANPKTRVSYIFDAIGLTPASMNYSGNMFDYGSFSDLWFVKKNTPCMIKYDGTKDYELNPEDYSKKLDGTNSDVDNVSYGGNAMSAIPTIWYSQYESGNYEYHIFCEEKYDETYHAFCHERDDGSIASFKYFPMFEGFFDGTKIRSLSGVIPTASQNGSTEMQRIVATGKQWNSITWNMVNLMKGLLTLMSKSEDSQAAFGNGNMASENYLSTGTINNKGQFYGYSSSASAVKVFHCENWWGNYWKRLRGMVCDKGLLKLKLTPPYNDTGLGYIDTGIKFVGNTGGYVKNTKTAEYGRIPMDIGGSSSTYLCDYLWWNDTILGYALFGGPRAYGTDCGSLAVNLRNTFATAYVHIVASLSCEMPL